MSQVTKRALEQSLKNLLLKKPLTKITVSDIAADCGINRMTFYYHFKDIYDLVEWACLEDAKRALDEKKTCDTWQQGLLQIFEAVQQNKPFILNVYRCVHREQVEKYLQPLVDHLLLDIIQEKSGGMTVRDEDKQFIAQSILPGESQAILTLEDGQTIHINKETESLLEKIDGARVHMDSTMLNYQVTSKTAPKNKPVYNKVETPRGGEYALLLSDGTKVHLNAMTSLRFPVTFDNGPRKVELEG